MPRETASRSILGEATYKKVRETPILVVGAGGIGCELCECYALQMPRAQEKCMPSICVSHPVKARLAADKTSKESGPGWLCRH